MPLPRISPCLAFAAALVSALAGATAHRAAAQAPSPECAARWSAFQAAADAKDLETAVAAEKTLATAAGCSRRRASARGVLLGLYREEAGRLQRESAPPARQLAALNAALGYADAWNAWDIYARIGDLKRRLPSAGGAPDPAGVALAYDAAVRTIDLAPPAARPPAAEIERLVRLAYQYEALSSRPVARRALFTPTARRIDVERTPVPLQFVYASDELTAAGKVQAETVLRLLKDEGMPPILLIGHTDPVGSDDYNDRLSLRRAVAVRDILIAGGYPADRIAARGRGKRDAGKLKIVDRSAFTVDQIHQMLRRVDIVWKQAATPRPSGRDGDMQPLPLRIVGLTAEGRERVAASLSDAALVGGEAAAALIWDARRQLLLDDQGRRIAQDIDAGALQSAIDGRRALQRLAGLAARDALAVSIRPRDAPAEARPSAAADAAHKAGTVLSVEVAGVRDDAYFAVFNLTGSGKVELIAPAAARDLCERPECATGQRKIAGVPVKPVEVVVRAPFGADHVVAVAGALPLTRLMPALARAHGRPAVPEVMAALTAELQAQPLQAGFRGLYSTRE
jgi:outer membrane protein OmpA-like peptidoglycan-associated protein